MFKSFLRNMTVFVVSIIFLLIYWQWDNLIQITSPDIILGGVMFFAFIWGFITRGRDDDGFDDFDGDF